MNENYTLYSTFYAESKYAFRISIICTHVCVIDGQRIFTSARALRLAFLPLLLETAVHLSNPLYPLPLLWASDDARLFFKSGNVGGSHLRKGGGLPLLFLLVRDLVECGNAVCALCFVCVSQMLLCVPLVSSTIYTQCIISYLFQ